MAELELNEGFSTLDNTSDEATRPNHPDESLILKLDIGSSVQDLVIHENDNPEEAVNKFCELHELPAEVCQVLLNKVLENLNPLQTNNKVQTKRFVKKGHFIKKEVNDRGRSALRPTESRLSPCRPASDESKFHESPVVRSKFRLESGARLLAKPRQQSNRIIKQYVPTQATESAKPRHQTLTDKTLISDSSSQDKPSRHLKYNKKPFSSTSNISSSITPSTSCSLSNKQSLNSNDYSHKLGKKLFSEEQSQTILNRIRFLKIKKIFEMIDSQKSGFVCTDNLASFPDPALSKVLKPILDEVNTKNLRLCLGEFESKVDLLLTRIPHNERMLLLGV